MTILVTGADGMLGSAMLRAAQELNIEVVPLGHRALDITNRNQIHDILGQFDNPTVINCAGIVKERLDVDTTFNTMREVNTLGPLRLAARAGRLLHVSTDCVFTGAIDKGEYSEDDKPGAQDAYGRTKLEGEVSNPPHLTVRCSFIGLGPRGLLHWLLSHPEGAEIPGYQNWLWNGWTAAALAPNLLTLALTPRHTGILHFPGPDVVTKGWLLSQVARRLRPDLQVVQVDAPIASRLVLKSSRRRIEVLGLTWDRMLDELAKDYEATKNGSSA